jgi:hypothetical protein
VMKQCKANGVIGFITFLSDNKRAERRLMTIVQRLGGGLIPSTGAWAAGSVEVRY